MAAVDVVVVGGGIAGLSAVALLARDHRTLLLERERTLAAHASGRNAAIHRPLEHDATSATLARRSLELLEGMAQDEDEIFIRRRGLLLVSAERESLLLLVEHGLRQGVACELFGRAELPRRASSLVASDVSHGVFVPEGGVLDIQALHRVLGQAARNAGATLRTGAGVARVLVQSGRVTGVILADGSEIDCQSVVIAAGAWGQALAAACGAALPLTAVRRHLCELELPTPLPESEPVVWRLDDELYYRPESYGVLASPCDATPWPAGEPEADPLALQRLRQKLARSAPSLARAKVRHYWACLRTHAPDRELVVGEDPRVSGLFWLGGLGGRGMAVAPAAGEVLAACLRHEAHPFSSVLSPRRLLEG